jgi:D-alanyl-D-alanine dipeptidase
MRRFGKIAIWISIFILVVFTLIASRTVIQGQNTQIIAQCPFPCVNPTANPTANPLGTPLIPDLQLNDQQRFLAAVAHKLSTIPLGHSFDYTILSAYGAVFINQDQGVKLPQKVVLDNEREAQEFQSTLAIMKVDGTRDCYLQKSATEAFHKARILQKIPLKSGFSGDCLRNFATNLAFWRKYANNRTLDQVKSGNEREILGLVAPPGTSQHLWGLAIDLRVSNAAQRQALNQNGWFQTVEHDVPHWTYLGVSEETLRQFGLQNKIVHGLNYWLTPLQGIRRISN